MYSACLFCSHDLGTNEVLESFPVGRRVAFDGRTGRLWVVCRRCERWNLTPLEERWEAIEQAERLFRGTMLRVSTEHIGLARLREGLELVRIGAPTRPEIAAWRYGDQFGRRRRRRFVSGSALVAAGGIIAAGGVALGSSVVFAWSIGKWAFHIAEHDFPGQHIARVRDAERNFLHVERRHLIRSSISHGADGGLALELAHTRGTAHLEGPLARRAAEVLFPAVNRLGGTPDDVQRAVARLEHAGGAESLLRDVARRGRRLTQLQGEHQRSFLAEDETDWDAGLNALAPSLSLAIEMALHEEQERRALEGELAELERAWREAEEIGAIADSLLLPPAVEAALARLRGRR
jgi:hypothetical protein